MAALLVKRGVIAASAHSKSAKISAQTLANFCNGDTQVLVTVMMGACAACSRTLIHLRQ